MHNIEWSVANARQASGVFVKPLTHANARVPEIVSFCRLMARRVGGEQLIGGRQYKQDPEDFGDEQVRHLQPDRCQENYVHSAESNLDSQRNGKKGRPRGALLLSPISMNQPQT